jgi:hypothetical protein
MHPQTLHQLAELDLAEREADRRRRPSTRRNLRRGRGRRVTPASPGREAEGTGTAQARRTTVRPDGPAGVRP